MTPHSAEPHALDRYRIHHPEAEEADLVRAAAASIPLDTALARTMVGRAVNHERWRNEECYQLAEDRRGIFVIHRSGSVITYLRFGSEQEQFALKHWPVDKSAPVVATAAPAPITKVAQLAQLRAMSIQALVQAIKSRAVWPSCAEAVTELFSRPLAVEGRPEPIKASHIKFHGDWGDGHRGHNGVPGKLKMALYEAKFTARPDGRVTVEFRDGRRGLMAQAGETTWALIED